MGKLRQPVTLAIGLAGSLLLGFVIAGWLGRIGSAQLLFVLLAYGLVLHPLSTLLHELGHAAAVLRLGRPVHVVTGRPRRARIRLGRLIADFGFLPYLGLSCNGVARYDPAGLSWRAIGWIALSGPAATFGLLAALAVVVRIAWNDAGIVVRYLIILWGVHLIILLVINLRPRPFKLPAGAALRGARDGWLAREAFARHRAGAPLLPRRVPGAGSSRATSVAPPR